MRQGHPNHPLRPTDYPMVASILIATHNRRAHLSECLTALPPEELQARSVEVLVCADGCTDDTEAWVRREFPHVVLIANPVQKHPAYSRNALAHAARGRFLICVDDDGVPEPGWLAAMLARDDGNTLVGGKIVDYTGGRAQNGPARSTFLGKRLPCRPDRANAGTSCNLGIPRNCFELLCGFDEELPYYFEDSDLCIRAYRAGFAFQFAEDAVVRHKGSAKRVGEAIRYQELHSTYAMLKAYRGSWVRCFLFTILNALWMIFRLVTWGIQGRFRDCTRLAQGWAVAYTRFWQHCKETPIPADKSAWRAPGAASGTTYVRGCEKHGIRIYGLTGGIGSGKSEVAKCLAACGVPVLQADSIGHEVLAPGGAAEKAVVEAFGEDIMVCGRIDRRRLAEKVFTNPERLAQLNAITHPVIVRKILEAASELAREGHRAVIIEAALWAEGGLREPWMDGLILVTAKPETRIKRLVERRGMSEEEARARLRAQSSPETKVAVADWVIDNDGGLNALSKKVDLFLEALYDEQKG